MDRFVESQFSFLDKRIARNERMKSFFGRQRRMARGNKTTGANRVNDESDEISSLKSNINSAQTAAIWFRWPPNAGQRRPAAHISRKHSSRSRAPRTPVITETTIGPSRERSV
jgi:hypothetical protein